MEGFEAALAGEECGLGVMYPCGSPWLHVRRRGVYVAITDNGRETERRRYVL